MSETSREFDWVAFGGEVVQHQVERVAVYENPDGNIVVRQERRWDEDDDVWIVIARAQAFAAARAILGAAGIHPDLASRIAARPDINWEAAEQDFGIVGARAERAGGAGVKDPTGAERQRRCRARKRDAAVTERDAPLLELVG